MKTSILQWNVWCDEDVANISRFLKKNKADIICLQELTINYPKQSIKHAPNYIAKELSYNFFYKELPIESNSGGKLMLANGIFSKYPIVKKDYYWTSKPTKAGGYNNEIRVFIETTLDIKGKELLIGTTHMSYTHMFEPTLQKINETDKLLKYIAKHQNRFIITGDFNAAPGSYTIEKFISKYQNLGPNYSQNTWTTKPFSYNNFEENNLNWRLDYIFGTKDVKLLESKILKTEFSDHLPIYSVIEF